MLATRIASKEANAIRANQSLTNHLKSHRHSENGAVLSMLNVGW